LKWLRRTLQVLAVIAVVAVIALAVGEQHLKGPLVHLLKVRTQRDIRIDGALDVHLFSLHPSITAQQVSIGNPPWSPAGVTARVESVRLDLEWQRSTSPLGLRRLELDDATLHLIRDSSGRASWWMHESGPGKGPPLMQSLAMSNARVDLNDAKRHMQFTGTVSATEPSAIDVAPPLRITGAGVLNGRAATFAIEGEPLATARRDRPYQFSFEEHSGASQLRGHGIIAQPFDLRALEATFAATGPNMKDIYFLVGLSLPNTGPYRFTGRLTRQGKRFKYNELAATTGRSDMSGNLTADATTGRTRVEGELSSQSLRLEDLGERAAGLAPAAAPETSLRIPDTPFRLGGMVRVDWTVQFRARTLAVGPEELHGVAANLTIDHGVLSLDRVKAALAQGTVSGSARLDASQKVPHGELTLRVADLPLEQFKSAKGDPPFGGLLSGRLQLSAKGNSFHELAAASNGTITGVVTQGSIRTALADAASLDLIGALGARRKDHDYTQMRCAVANLNAQGGLLTARTFLIDADKVLINGAGQIQLDSESLDLTLTGQPRNARFGLHSALAIQGTLKHPQIKRVGHNAMVAVLKALLEPVTAALQWVDPKLTGNPDCAALTAQTQP
jgi:AsmA family protein